MMKLWLLEAKENLPDGDDPWGNYYGVVLGVVVCAESEKHARELVSGEAEGEGTSAWLNCKYSSCKELLPGETEKVILMDFRAS